MPTMSVCRVLALRFLSGGEQSLEAIIEAISTELALEAETRAQRTPTGENRLLIRVRWALASLRRVDYVAAKKPGMHAITPRGRAMLAHDPVRIDERGTGSLKR